MSIDRTRGLTPPTISSWQLASITTAAIGLVLLTIGALGAIPPLHDRWDPDAPHVVVRNGIGYILGVIPNNKPLTVLHVLTGIWGIAAARDAPSMRLFLGSAAIGYALLAVAGLFPLLRTAFGLMPLFGPNILIHAIVASAAAWTWTSLASAHHPPQERMSAIPADEGVRGAVAIAGRPVHAMLAPFPIAFLTAALVTDLAFWWITLPWYHGDETFFSEGSLWLVGAGLGTGLAATAVGLIDWLVDRRIRSVSGARAHLLLGAATMLLALMNLLVRLDDPRGAILPWGVILSAVTVIVLAPTVWHGLGLVYRQGAGVRHDLGRNDRDPWKG
jgi:uncharacterized membrane protein